MSSSTAVWFVPILVAFVTGFATVITVYLTGRANLRLEREKFGTNSQLERQKFESSLVLQAIATGDQETARKNLDFLVNSGYLPDPKQQIQELASEPEGTPVLPSPSVADESLPTRPTFRWLVRTGADPDAQLVDDTPVQTTVEELVKQPRPADMLPANVASLAYQNRRAEGVERTVYQLEADIIGSKLMVSGSYALILRDASGQTMIANCPDPDPRLVEPKGRWVKQIADVHNHVRDRLAPGKARTRYADLHVRITGVGYFNRVTGRTGEAPNGIELSPVLSLEWLSDSGTSTRRAEKAKA